jgi:hypothetical protein
VTTREGYWFCRSCLSTCFCSVVTWAHLGVHTSPLSLCKELVGKRQAERKIQHLKITLAKFTDIVKDRALHQNVMVRQTDIFKCNGTLTVNYNYMLITSASFVSYWMRRNVAWLGACFLLHADNKLLQQCPWNTPAKWIKRTNRVHGTTSLQL